MRNSIKNLLMFLALCFIWATNIYADDFGPGELNFVEKWCILLDYDEANPISEEELLKYDMVILDADSHPPLENIKDKVILIAYVSLGEAETYRSYWSKIKDKTWVIGENADWKGNYYVDIRSDEWRNIIINDVIPSLLAKGFKGIFMDTLDTATMLETDSPEKYNGANAAMINFVKEIREKNHDIYILSNNGFLILGGIAQFLDAAAAEDVNMMVDFENGGYKRVPRDESEYKIRALELVKNNLNIPVFVIDYVSSGDIETIKECKDKMVKKGFKPYVAEKDLNVIYVN